MKDTEQQQQQHRHWEWSRLAPELRHRILHLLPLPNALVARAVCREWKNTLSTWSEPKPWFLVKDEQAEHEGSLKWSLVDAETGLWIRLKGFGSSRFATSVTAGDGLVCFCVGNSVRPEFYVGNPLFEKSLQRLPEMPPLKTLTLARLVLSASALTCVLGIVCSDTTGGGGGGGSRSRSRSPSFKVLVGRCGYIIVYDSSSRKWSEVQGETPPLALQLLQESDAVPVRRGDRLLWSPLRSGGGVVGFDFEELAWFVLDAALFERLSSASLTRDPVTGSVFLVGAHRSSGSHHFRHLKVWKLDEDDDDLGSEWKPVNRMRDFMLQEISPKGFFAAQWRSGGGGGAAERRLMLLTCTLEKFSSQLRDWGFKRLVLWSFDPAAGKWSANPLRRPLRDLDLSTTVVYSFRPRLDFFEAEIDG